MIRNLVFTAVFIFSNVIFAQENDSKFSVFLDVVSLSQKGFGIKADYAVNQFATIGFFSKKYASDSEGFTVRFNDDNKYEFSEQGIVGTYFPQAVNENGLYFSLAYAQAKHKLTYVDTVFGSAIGEDKIAGAQAKAGYQFVKSISDNSSCVVQMGLGYGVAGESDYVYTSPPPEVKVDLKNGTLIDLAVGVAF